MLGEAFPEEGFLGEEGTRVESRSGRLWIIDPIDGTRDYVRGRPLWANLIALEAGDQVVAGVVNLPVLGGLYHASRGGGAFQNDSSIQVSSRTLVEEAGGRFLNVNGGSSIYAGNCVVCAPAFEPEVRSFLGLNG